MPSKKNLKDISYTPLIYNPKSGLDDGGARKKQVMQKLAELGWNGEIISLTAKKTAGILANECIQKGYKHLVVCGGDGTVREVLEQIINTDVIMGIIPLGTGNILAKNVGIPTDIGDAVTCALLGKTRKIDVGRANGIVFGMTASMGIGVDAMAGANKKIKKRFGLLAYFAAAYQKMSTPLTRYKIVLDNKTTIRRRAKGILATNVGSTIGGITLSPDAGLQSGDLTIAVIKARWVRDWLNLLFHAFIGDINKSQHYDILKAQKIEITPRNPKRFECDGTDFPATSKLTIELLPKAAKIMVPTDDYLKRLLHKNENILIFDFDGTIADTLKLTFKVFNLLAPKFGYPPISIDQIDHFRGKSAREVIQSMGISALQIPIIYAEGRKEFLKHTADIAAFPHIKLTLEELSKNYGLGIVTSNDADIVAEFLKKNGMEMFTFIYSDKSIFGKGAILKHLLGKYKFDPTKVTYVGDEVRDIDAAREAGLKIISVSWGFNTKAALQSHNPNVLVDSPEELLSTLKVI